MKYPEPKKLYPTKKRDFYLEHFSQRYQEPRFSKLMDKIFERCYYLELVADKKREEAGVWVDKSKIDLEYEQWKERKAKKWKMEEVK